jgi:DNA-directed RNA polymerase specialized sigma24 family protein
LNPRLGVEDRAFAEIEAGLYLREIFGATHNLHRLAPDILGMTFYDGMTGEEIADALNLNINTVKSIKARARRLLGKRAGQLKNGA